ncbi:rhodopsin, GQ-coupled-like [Haliotis rubra]|uniref:rhodopsin, GQ-coupled-like n=1 Tax=Haliotis rubra TaxID=36100 RepID=UPI001EE5C596|nr:rhodopsin, GQ-coupled-like [Haliotis rubra]XP_046577926.1 rhodopsin, GQ-coupled-like [Haliotis rubra]
MEAETAISNMTPSEPNISSTTLWTNENPDYSISSMNTTPQTVGSSEYMFERHGAEIIFLLSMFFFAIFGNILVIYIYHFRWRRSNFSLFIEVLAFLDLINASITIPLFLVITFDESRGDFAQLCQGASFVAIMTAMGSGVILVIIAFDRNRKICKPLKREISLSLTRRCCLFAIFLGILLAMPSIFIYGEKDMPFEVNGVRLNITQCYFTKSSGPLFWSFMSLLGFVFTVVMFALGVLYVSMYRALRVHLARRESLGSSRRPSTTSCKPNTMRSQKTSAKIFFAVTVAFFSSYFPFFIAVTVFLFGYHGSDLSPGVKAVADIAKLSPLMSNAINPIIYSVSSQRFRKELVDVFRCAALKRTPSQRARQMVHIKTHTSSTVD